MIAVLISSAITATFYGLFFGILRLLSRRDQERLPSPPRPPRVEAIVTRPEFYAPPTRPLPIVMAAGALQARHPHIGSRTASKMSVLQRIS
ncbi:hypothetical protein [Nocardia suismassiliense]|uniref:hypothetical protein n=1 Tax=Nocardia suismassiliense TaxID=2077092 RepID=UPI00131F3246|nr:hypothetical protein [Nocardia suismassiliense]